MIMWPAKEPERVEFVSRQSMRSSVLPDPDLVPNPMYDGDEK